RDFRRSSSDHRLSGLPWARDNGDLGTQTVNSLLNLAKTGTAGLVMYDLTNISGRLEGDSPWAFQVEDILANEAGIQRAIQEGRGLSVMRMGNAH
ncbi:MAG: hypothetical protein AB1634_10295, partial [Thermodesulfobacteriota bacterium]